jgi:hypothetical protein
LVGPHGLGVWLVRLLIIGLIRSYWLVRVRLTRSYWLLVIGLIRPYWLVGIRLNRPSGLLVGRLIRLLIVWAPGLLVVRILRTIVLLRIIRRVARRIDWPLDRWHWSDGVRSWDAARVGRIWLVGPLALIALGARELIASRPVLNGMSRRGDDGPPRKRPCCLRHLPYGSSDWSCIWLRSDLFSLLIDQHGSLI